MIDFQRHGLLGAGCLVLEHGFATYYLCDLGSHTFQCLTFIICKMRVRIVPTHMVEELTYRKCLQQCPTHTNCYISYYYDCF